MRVRQFSRIVAVTFTVALLANCGGDTKKLLGLQKEAPDEFAVYSRAPLSLPPDFTLTPPAPGTERPQSIDESAKAQQALLGRQAAPETNAKDYQNLTPGLRSLLQNTGALNADPNIRRTIDRETTAFITESKHFTDDLLFWKDPKEFGSRIDAAKESQRIRDAQALGESVDGADAIVIEQKEEAILEGLFN